MVKKISKETRKSAVRKPRKRIIKKAGSGDHFLTPAPLPVGVAPQLPATASIAVLAGEPIGTVIGSVTLLNTPVPSATWSMAPAAGLSINSVTGNITITDDTAFYAALGAEIVTTVTAYNSVGSSSCTFTVLEEIVSPPYTFENSPWAITVVPASFAAPIGAVVANIESRVPGSTITCSVGSVIVENSSGTTTTGTIVFSSAPGITRYVEGGRYPITVTETAAGLGSRSLDIELILHAPTTTWGGTWTPFINDHYVTNAYMQEDVSAGDVMIWPNRGGNGATYNAQQSNASYRPTKLSGTDGVEFDGDDVLQIAGDQERYTSIRTTLTIFRVDLSTGSSPGTTWIVAPQINTTVSGTSAQTKIAGGVLVQKLGDQTITRWRDARGANEITVKGLHPDYSTWCFVIQYHRDGKRYVKFNGEDAIWHGHHWFIPQIQADPSWHSFLGFSDLTRSNPTNPPVPYSGVGSANSGNCTFALDCHMELGEVSDEFIAKLERWAADRAGLTLPTGHKYRVTAPVVDESDFPLCQYKFNHPEWRVFQQGWEERDRYWGGSAFPSSLTDPFDTTIFYEDFREKSIAPSTSVTTTGNLYSVGGAAGNTIGINGALVQVNGTPDLYTWSSGEQNLLAGCFLGSSGNEILRASLLSSVDGLDNGITFKGGYYAKVRFKMSTAGVAYAGAFFNCPMWFYSNTRAKLAFNSNFEFDLVEIENRLPASSYLNHGAYHNHSTPMTPGYNGRNPNNQDPDPYGSQSTVNRNRLLRKSHGGYMDVTRDANWQGPFIDLDDGEWHTAEFVQDPVTNTFSIAIDGLETTRMLRTSFWDYRLHLMINTGIRGNTGNMSNGDVTTVTIGEVLFKKRAADVAAVPAWFDSAPSISGEVYVGNRITVAPNLSAEADGQVRVEWYHDDGYPITRERGTELKLTAADVGKEIRAKVIPVGYWEDDEAWSALYGPVVSGANPITTADIQFQTGGTITVNGTPYADLDELNAAIPGFVFNRAQTGSVVDFSTGAATPFVAAHGLRLHPYGLVYEAAETMLSNTYIPSGQENMGLDPYVLDGPAGVNTMHAIWETSGTASRRICTIGLNNTVFDQRSSGVFLLGRGIRRYVRVESPYGGSKRTFFDTATGTVTGQGGAGLLPGVVASMTAVTGFPEHWWCFFSATDPIAAGTTNASMAIYPAANLDDITSSYVGDTSGIIYKLGFYQARASTSRNLISLPWYGTGTRLADELQLPLGGTPRDVVLTVVDPDDGTESTQTLTGVSGDYVIPAASLNQPIIKRIQIS